MPEVFNTRDDSEVIDGIEYLRRHIFQVSKPTWRESIAPYLPIIELSTHRKGVRRADWRAFVESRTRRVAEAA